MQRAYIVAEKNAKLQDTLQILWSRMVGLNYTAIIGL